MFENPTVYPSVSPVLLSLYEFYREGAKMYTGSEKFSYKDKEDRYEVKGYWYRGTFYRLL